jgi:hypothetical protein
MTPEVNEQAMAYVRLVSILNQLHEMELGAISRAIGTPKAPRLVSKSSQAPPFTELPPDPLTNSLASTLLFLFRSNSRNVLSGVFREIVRLL